MNQLLIMIFAFCLVVIGVYPLHKEHGSIFNFISDNFTAIADTVLAPENRRRGTAPSGAGKSAMSIGEPEIRVVEPERQRDADQHSVQDRRALDRLIEGL